MPSNSLKDYYAEKNRTEALEGLASAMASKESPEETAARLRKARDFDVEPQVADGLTPAEVDNFYAQDALKEATPVYLRKAGEVDFANLTKDDLPTTFSLESLWWKIMGAPAKADGALSTTRNSTARGGYGLANAMPIFGNAAKAERIRSQLLELENTEKQLAQGVSAEELFGSEDDPTGEAHRVAFEHGLPALRTKLQEELSQALKDTAWNNSMSGLYPHNEASQKLSEAKTAGEAIELILSNPSIIADIGPESLVQYAPMLPILAASSFAGPAAPALMGGLSGAYSYGLDKASGMMSGMAENAVNVQNGASIFKFMTDPKLRGIYENVEGEAERHAAGVALFDGLSAGLAGKLALPAFIKSRISSPFAKEMANMAVQTPIQGALGSAGEASGQLLAKGEITNWGDVVAEFAGEGFTAPIEVLSAGAKRLKGASIEQARAEATAEAFKKLGEYSQASKLIARDPQTAAEYIEAVAEDAGPDKRNVLLDGQSLHQEGLDTKLIQLLPERAEEITKAVQEGSEIAIPVGEFTTKVATSELNQPLAELVRVKGQMSLHQAREVQEEIMDMARQEAETALKKDDSEFRESSKRVGQDIASLMENSGATKAEQGAITTVLSTLVNNLARDLGVLPEVVWAEHGLKRVLDGNAQVQGDSLHMPSPIYDKTFGEFLEDSVKARFVKKINVAQGVGEFIEKNFKVPVASTEIQMDKDRGNHAKKHQLSTQEWVEVMNLPAEANFIGSGRWGDRVWMSKKLPNGKWLSAVFLVTYNANRKGEKLRLGLATAFTGTEGQYRAWLKKNRFLAEKNNKDGEYAAVRNLPLTSLTSSSTGTVHGYDNHLEKAIDSSSYADMIPRKISTDPATLVAPDGNDRTEVLPSNGAKVSLSQDNMGDYFPDSKTIVRWFSADQSTLLHESGHFYLDMLIDISKKLQTKGELSAGEKRVLDRTLATLKWLGADSLSSWEKLSFEERRPMHEKFARHYEAYLFEGNAPTKGLRAVFRRFSQWLRSIYTVVSNIPGVEMSDDVRALFDQLFISTEQVQEARYRRGMFKMFESFAESGFTEEAWLNYVEQYRETDAEAIEYMRARGMRDMAFISNLRGKTLDTLRKKSEGERKRIESEVRSDLSKTPIYEVWDFLKNGKDKDGVHISAKLTPSELKAVGVDDAGIKRLLEEGLVGGDGDPQFGEQTAQAYGYQCLAELAQALVTAPNLEQAVQAATQERMYAEHGELATEEEIQRTADEAIFNPSLKRLLATEISAMEKAAPGRLDIDIFEKMAEQEILSLRVKDIDPKKFRTAAGLRAKEARRLQKQGDIKGAIRAKRQELYQTCLAIEAKKAVEAWKKDVKFFNKLVGKNQIEGLSTDYLVTIQRLLENMGISTSRQLGEGHQLSLREFLESLFNQEKTVPPIDPSLEQRLINHRMIFANNKKPFEEMSRSLQKEAAQAVRDLYRAGRKEQQILNGEQAQELSKVVGELSGAIVQNAQSRGREGVRHMEETGPWVRFKEQLERIGMSHARIPSLLAAMEGTRFGKFFDYVISRADSCGTKEVQLKNEYAVKLFAATKVLQTKRKDRVKRYFKSVGAYLSQEQVRAIALNAGNKENLQRLIDGSESAPWSAGKKWTKEQIFALIGEALSAEELAAVQKVWDVFNELWPQIAEKERRVYGRVPVRVEPQALTVTLADGQEVTLKGGYYPIQYDKKASFQAQDQNDMQAAKELMDGAHSSRTARRGFLEKRLAHVYDRPLSLTLRAAFEGLDAEIHELCWQEWLADTNKIFRQKKLRETIRDYWGVEAEGAIRKWIEDIAAGTSSQKSMGDGIAALLRANVSLVGIGFNLVTALIQPIGMLQTVTILGPQWSAKGIGEFMLNPYGKWKEVCGKSQAMADRSRTRFRELTEIQALVSGTNGALKDKFMRSAYLPIVFMQALVDVPTWLGAYNKALSEGNTEARAIAIADRTVTDAQGGGRTQDLSGIERGGEWAKLFTVFYTFFNTALNIAMVTGHTQKGMKRALNLLTLLAFQPIIETFVREGLKATVSGGDDDDWLKKTSIKAGGSVVNFNLGLLVGLREVAELGQALSEGEAPRGYSGTGGLRKVVDLYRLGQAVSKDSWDENTLRAAVTVLGEWSPVPIPVVPINRAISGKKAMEEGKTENPLAVFLGYSSY
jgi:hypothetical protein|nr:MAG TPA: crystallin beta/gamma motif-containing protein [Caudoviricetes sp.]